MILFYLAGAMRFPGDVNDDTDRPHFLTSAYVNKFEGLKIQMFPNSDPNGITNIYGLKEKTSGMYVSKPILGCANCS
jgi:hypothetical protein